MTNSKTDARQVGFEIEFSDVPLHDVARVIERRFGGEVEQRTSAEWIVKDTSIGSFVLEIDANPIKKTASAFAEEPSSTNKIINKIQRKVSSAANTVVDTVGAKVAPLEIVGPPIPVSEIHKMDELREALKDESALGTKTSFHHAFGLHINPEAKSLEADNIAKHIQAFALLYENLLDWHRVDTSRRLSTFISSYPTDYVDLIAEEGYAPSIDQLIKDYHRHNSSRNRALDMLPLFAHMDAELVRELYGRDEKINARPTYHYRLPNSEIDNPSWSLQKEWERWLIIEAVADNWNCLTDLKEAWRGHDANSIIGALEGEEEWKKTVSNILEKHDVDCS